MLIEVPFAQLHDSLFLAGANLGLKLDASKRQGLKIAYNETKDRLEVTYNGQTAILKNGWFSLSGPSKIFDVETTPEIKPEVRVQTAGSVPMRANISHTAQVSTPHGLDRSKL